MLSGIREKIDVLTKIQHIASSMAKELNIDTPRLVLPPDFDSTIPELNLPFPHDILKPLYNLQIPDSTLQALLQCFTSRIIELQQQNVEMYKRTCRSTASSPHFMVDLSLVHRVYESRYQNECLPIFNSWVALATEKATQFSQRNIDTKPLFNVEYTPILEKYFDYNGYPSGAHRAILAQKSCMTPRQIEVWFQNHRRRSRQDGKIIPRLESDIPLRMALQIEISTSKPRFTRLPTPADDETHETSRAKMPQTSKDSILIHATISDSHTKPATFLDESYAHRPPHAYPLKWKSISSDPFPTSEGVFKFPQPIWRRKPATAPLISTAIDMEEFARVFHLKLNFSENSRRRGSTPPRNETPFSQPWFHATVTLPSSAPHPALLRTPHAPTSISPISVPSSFTPIFGSNSLQVPRSTPPFPSADTSARKVRSLPRRRPPQSRSTSSGSRTSSFGSDTSSLSSSGHSSPEPSTPPPLPQAELPLFFNEGQQHDPFDFSHTRLITGVSLPNIPSQGFIVTNPCPLSNKLADDPFSDSNFPDFCHNLGEVLP